MRKLFLYMGFITMLFLYLTACSFKDEEAERTPDIDFYIQYASERFGVPEEEISVVQFNKAATYRYGLDRKGTHMHRPDIRLEWNGKMVCFEYAGIKDFYDTSKLRDDYYYDELVEGVREYYMRNLGLDNVIVEPVGIGSSYSSNLRVRLVHGYNDYLRSHDVTEVNDAVIADFIEQINKDSQLYVELKGEDPEAEIKELIDKLKQIDCDLTVFVMKSLSGLSMYHMPREEIENYYGILPLCFEGYHLTELWYQIKPESKVREINREYYIEYQDYYYKLIQNEEKNAPAEMDRDTLDAIAEFGNWAPAALPDGYTEYTSKGLPSKHGGERGYGYVYRTYVNDAGHTITLNYEVTYDQGTYETFVDYYRDMSEVDGYIVTDIAVQGLPAGLVENADGTPYMLVWISADGPLAFTMYAEALTSDELIAVADSVALQETSAS